MENKIVCWKICPECKGEGKKKRRIRKGLQLRYQTELAVFAKNNFEGISPIPPKAQTYTCSNCAGSGLIASQNFMIPDSENYPHVAIVGGGIGGVAFAVACLHRGIPFTLFERDTSFDMRSQGYGLTLQQASKAIKGLGIFNLEKGVVSTRHVVHTTDGKIIAEWGMRKWLEDNNKDASKKTNIHIARQSLRYELLKQLDGTQMVKWGHQFVNFNENANGKIDVNFEVNGRIKTIEADLLVGADGIRSAVRSQLIGEEISPLRYLGCIVILGICELSALENKDAFLLDSATVFQTAMEMKEFI